MEKKKIEEIAKTIHVIKPFNDPIFGSIRYGVMPDKDIFGQSCIWDDPVKGKEAFIKEEIGRFNATHTYGYYGMFKPSLGEIVEAIPEDLLGKFNAVTVECIGYTQDSSRHLSEVTCYNVEIKEL